MQADLNLIPVKSDVNQFMEKERFMLDNDFQEFFSEFKIASLLKSCNIRKRSGHPVPKIIFDLVNIPFLFMSGVFLFVSSQYEKAASDKNRFYRLLENANYNWRLFILGLSFMVGQKISPNNTKEDCFVVDDTITPLTGKLVEGASYVYDHTCGKSILGFQKLVLGLFNDSHFIPISQKICISKQKPKGGSKAKKYKKIPKSEKICSQCPGALEREELNLTKLAGAVSLLKAAKRKGFNASTVLLDSWYCFNSFIKQVAEGLELKVICQLKNLPKPNKYIYKGRAYSLKGLFVCYGKGKLRIIKKHQYKLSVLVVDIPDSKTKLKIVFVQNPGAEKWHAFAATDATLQAKTILEHYSRRWSIEVFFKNCKQYLNYGREQMSNLDSIIASDAMVFLRYLILTYLANKENASFYNVFDRQRNTHTTNTFGMRLLKYFLNKLQFVIQEIHRLVKNNCREEALLLLEMVADFEPDQETYAWNLN